MFEGLREYIASNLQKRVTSEGLNDYQIFGKQVEELISDLIEEYLKEKEIKYIATRAKNKNDFPDLKLNINNLDYALEHKSGRSDNAGNDLGTLRSYKEKIEKFGDRIYCVFVKYSVCNNNITIDAIYFDKIYKFIGNFPSSKRDDILSYRKKDGNLRPKSWECFEKNISYTNTFKEFERNIEETIKYRALQLVLEHIEHLTEEDKTTVYKELDKMIKKK